MLTPGKVCGPKTQNGMSRIFKYCFDKWWRPIIFLGLTTAIAGISVIILKSTLFDYSAILFAIGLVGLIISTVNQLVKRKWLFAFLTILTIGLGVIGFFLLLVIQFSINQSTPDTFANRLKIPVDIEIYEPKSNGWDDRPDSIFQIDGKELDFELYKSFQPGLYRYDIWIGKIESGTVYLKAYEITQNDRLSKYSLTERSSIRVGNPTDEIKRFGIQEDFTIYEGEFGQPYAARFEVWYKPEKGKRRKLTEKNYKIEGWQR